MSESGPPSTLGRSRGRSRGKSCLLGCLGALVVVGVLGIAGCVAFVVWIGAEGEVSEHSELLAGGEELFASLYLTPDNEALLELTKVIIERNQEMQNSMGGIQRFMPKPDPEKASRQQIEEVLPLRVEGALYPTASGAYEHLLKAELSQQYRLYGLMFRGAAMMVNFAAADDESVRVESIDGITTIVSRQREAASEHGVSFVGNTFYWASPPSRIAGAEARRAGEPARYAPPDARIPVILEDVGGDTNPVWALMRGPTLDALARELATDGDPGAAALAGLLVRTDTLALGFDLEDANTASLRLAGLTARDEPIDGPLREALATPIDTRTEAGFELRLGCEERGSERWSCEGSVLGFRDAFLRMMDAAQSQMEAQRSES